MHKLQRAKSWTATDDEPQEAQNNIVQAHKTNNMAQMGSAPAAPSSIL